MEAERRHVTVLFADMVGFTPFSERWGEEAAYSLMRSLSKLMGESVNEQVASLRASPAMASWRPSARLRTRLYGLVERPSRSWNVSRKPDLILKLNTAYGRRYALA